MIIFFIKRVFSEILTFCRCFLDNDKVWSPTIIFLLGSGSSCNAHGKHMHYAICSDHNVLYQSRFPKSGKNRQLHWLKFSVCNCMWHGKICLVCIACGISSVIHNKLFYMSTLTLNYPEILYPQIHTRLRLRLGNVFQGYIRCIHCWSHCITFMVFSTTTKKQFIKYVWQLCNFPRKYSQLVLAFYAKL